MGQAPFRTNPRPRCLSAVPAQITGEMPDIYIYIYSFRLGKMVGQTSILRPYCWVFSRLSGPKVDYRALGPDS